MSKVIGSLLPENPRPGDAQRMWLIIDDWLRKECLRVGLDDAQWQVSDMSADKWRGALHISLSRRTWDLGEIIHEDIHDDFTVGLGEEIRAPQSFVDFFAAHNPWTNPPYDNTFSPAFSTEFWTPGEIRYYRAQVNLLLRDCGDVARSLIEKTFFSSSQSIAGKELPAIFAGMHSYCAGYRKGYADHG